MNEQDFARSVGRHLDPGLDELPPSVLYRLRVARDAALARARELQASPAATGGTDESVPGRQGWVLNRRLLAPFAVVLLALLGVLFWQQEVQIGPTQHADFADVDTEVLTDDLPVVAYLDPGFEIWLYHHSPATAED
jgi:hypothetical protein